MTRILFADLWRLTGYLLLASWGQGITFLLSGQVCGTREVCIWYYYSPMYGQSSYYVSTQADYFEE